MCRGFTSLLFLAQCEIDDGLHYLEHQLLHWCHLIPVSKQ
jgi:hypothetical protein